MLSKILADTSRSLVAKQMGALVTDVVSAAMSGSGVRDFAGLLTASPQVVARSVLNVPAMQRATDEATLSTLVGVAQKLWPKFQILSRVSPTMRVGDVDAVWFRDLLISLGLDVTPAYAESLVATLQAVNRPDTLIRECLGADALLRIFQGVRQEVPVTLKLCASCGNVLDPLAISCSCGDIHQ